MRRSKGGFTSQGGESYCFNCFVKHFAQVLGGFRSQPSKIFYEFLTNFTFQIEGFFVELSRKTLKRS